MKVTPPLLYAKLPVGVGVHFLLPHASTSPATRPTLSTAYLRPGTERSCGLFPIRRRFLPSSLACTFAIIYPNLTCASVLISSCTSLIPQFFCPVPSCMNRFVCWKNLVAMNVFIGIGTSATTNPHPSCVSVQCSASFRMTWFRRLFVPFC